MIYSLSAFLLCIMTLGLTGLYITFAKKKKLYDLPNNRSSHVVPTPRGGGLVLSALALIAYSLMFFFGAVTSDVWYGIAGGSAVILIIGFFDDVFTISSRLRLAIHFGVAAWILFWLGVPDVFGFPDQIIFKVFLAGLGTLYIVWLLNLYNFMDGINGIAGLQAVLFSGLMLLLLWIDDASFEYWILLLILGAVVIGFLFWNFPAAKVFLGDSGSGFLGVVIAAYSIYITQLHTDYFWVALILLSLFISDATITLVRRVLNKNKFDEAHRSHMYQILSRRWGSHVKPVICLCAMSVFVLFPLSYLVVEKHISGVITVIALYFALWLLEWKIGAGLIND